MCAYKRISPMPIIEGGTAKQSFTAFSVIAGGTTSTGALQSIASLGSSGQVLTSNGAAALPTWQNNGSGTITSVVTANATPQFVLGGSTETIDFGIDNMALGSTLPSLTPGFPIENLSYGYHANHGIVTAAYNTAIGFEALLTNATGDQNTAIGSRALRLNNVAAAQGSNTAVGAGAIYRSTTGQNNTGVGTLCLNASTTGSRNCAFGTGCLPSITTGSDNIGIGFGSGINYVSTESSNIVISNNGTAAESNVIRIGTTGSGSGQQNRCFLAGTYGITPASTSPKSVIMDSAGQMGTAGDPVYSATLTLTSAQIKNLNATPQTLIAAPGSGKAINVINCMWEFIYGGSNVFVAGAAQTIGAYYGSSAGSNVATCPNNAAIVSSASLIGQFASNIGSAGVAKANIDNQALVLQNPVATEISGNAANDNTIKYTVYYTIVTL